MIFFSLYSFCILFIVKDGPTRITPVLQPAAVLASETAGFNTEYESKLKAEISGAYTFLSRVYVGASAAVVFACPDAFSYNGFQWRIDAIWNIFHDLQLSSAIYQYIGKNGGNDKLSLSVSGAFVF